MGRAFYTVTFTDAQGRPQRTRTYATIAATRKQVRRLTRATGITIVRHSAAGVREVS